MAVHKYKVKQQKMGTTKLQTGRGRRRLSTDRDDYKLIQSLAQKMTISLSRFQFKTVFIFLVSLTFTALVIICMSKIPVGHSTIRLRSFHSYMRTNAINKTLLTPTSLSNHNQRKASPTEVEVTTRTRQDVSGATQVEGWRYHEAHPHNYHYILDEPEKCEQLNPFLTLMVPVAPQQLQARDAIRSTWGNESVVHGKTVAVLFLLGLPRGADNEKLQEQLWLESQQHHDLIQSNFMDTYNNLTIKTMVIMDWLATHCPQATFAMKVDSDMFLNLDNLMSMLLAPDIPRENYMTGMVMWNRPVVRNRNSKWYVPIESYAEEYYPTYLLGMGYVFSNDLPERIVAVSKDLKPFNIEDAYIGLCLKKLGVSPSTPPDPSQFHTYFDGNYQQSNFDRVITTILGSPQELVTIWQDLKKPTWQSQGETFSG
ncbi:beta-1,3-galactosyltransferase 1 [Electrophorus electricus]|uniref:beta-1,3-galactosyltransferase 1 n=1 Tax=Electrophorus electricus TaxID=8005 RepID=UPI0015D03FEB|nr:beta-1,3-galactosyltransferase 1 [Electrophorus electricus]